MPPKTRVSSRLASKKRKAEEVDDLSEEDRPTKRQKIEKKAPKKAPAKKTRTKITKIILESTSSSEEEISDQKLKKSGKKAPKRRVVKVKPQTAPKEKKEESYSESSSSSPESSDEEINVKVKKTARRAPKAVAKKIHTKAMPNNKNTNTMLINKDTPNPAELKAAALRKLATNKEAAKYTHRLEDEEYTLPDELILQIFSTLRRRDLYGVGLTCRQWLRLSNDQSLGWHNAYSAVLVEYTSMYIELDEYAEKRREISGHDWEEQDEMNLIVRKDYLQKHRGAPVTVRFHKPRRNAFYNPGNLEEEYSDELQIEDEKGDIVGLAELLTPYSFKRDTINDIPWSAVNNNTDLWGYRVREATKQDVKDSGIFDDDEGGALSDSDSESEEVKDRRRWIVDLEINVKRLERLVEEKQVVPGMTFIYQLVEYDFADKLTTISSTKQSSIPKRSFTAQQQPEGFKDEIKLYKYQLDAISWMKSVEDNKDGLPYFTAYPWRRAKTDLIFDLTKKEIVTNLEAYVDVAKPKGGVLADEMGLGKTMEMIGLVLANPAPAELLEHPTLFTSRATLVLCPNHLAKQWSDELAKVTDLKVATVTTIVQLRKFSYQDFVDYDVVIVSYQLLQNPNYFFLGSNAPKKTNVKKRQELERTAWVESSLEAVKSSKNGGLGKACPIFEHIYWYRLVMDEGHEYLHVPYFKYVIGTYQSRYSWYVTGTPFPSLKHFKQVKEFLGLEVPDATATNSYWVRHTSWGDQKESTLSDLLLRELYWRHTKETVKGEYQIPDCVEDLVLMEFDEIESVLYADARDEGTQSRICGSILQDTGLDDRLTRLIQRKDTSIPALKKSIPNLVKAVAAARRRYEDEREPLAKSVAQSALKRHEDSLAESEAQLAHDKKVLEMAKKVVPFKKRGTKAKTDLTELISQHGTKLSQMIVYLRKLFEHKPKSRVIFFSQFNDTLNSVSTILSEHNIDNVFVEGNVFKRNKAISSFKNEDDIKVIMLSLRNAASGTNLIEATHVILMDPVTGSKKEAQAIESQAIGRAHRQGQTKQITIVRFVVKNTIEHALYLRNNDVNEDTTVVVSKDNKPQLVKTASLTSLVAANATLQRSGSFARPLEDVQNNTNVLPNNN
jgi:SNF2 family DNA or RNA helicase